MYKIQYPPQSKGNDCMKRFWAAFPKYIYETGKKGEKGEKEKRKREEGKEKKEEKGKITRKREKREEKKMKEGKTSKKIISCILENLLQIRLKKDFNFYGILHTLGKK